MNNQNSQYNQNQQSDNDKGSQFQDRPGDRPDVSPQEPTQPDIVAQHKNQQGQNQQHGNQGEQYQGQQDKNQQSYQNQNSQSDRSNQQKTGQSSLGGNQQSDYLKNNSPN